MADNRTAAFQWFLSQGYSPAAAAGIVGNLVQESGVNPNVRPGDNGSAFGVAQWRGDRYAALNNYVAAHGGNNDLSTQLGFLDYELRNRYGSTFNKLMAARDPREATAAFALGYERPAGAQTGVAENVDGWGNRLNAANAVYGGQAPTQTAQPSPPQIEGLLSEPRKPIQSQEQNVSQRITGLLGALQNQNTDAPMMDTLANTEDANTQMMRARQRLAQARIS